MLYDIIERKYWKKTGKYIYFMPLCTKEQIQKISGEMGHDVFKKKYMIIESR